MTISKKPNSVSKTLGSFKFPRPTKVAWFATIMPEFFKATMQDAAATLFVSPTKNDEHVVGDMILHDIDTIIAWRPDDDATHDHALMKKEVERTGMFLQVNGQTLVDAR